HHRSFHDAGHGHRPAPGSHPTLTRESTCAMVTPPTMRRATLIILMACVVAARARTDQATGIPFADVVRPRPGEWPTYNGNLSSNRFSPLDQINATTIHSLAPKWMFTIHGAPRALQMTPIVVDGVMYVTSVNEAFALDARSGKVIWHYSRPRTQGLAGD